MESIMRRRSSSWVRRVEVAEEAGGALGVKTVMVYRMIDKLVKRGLLQSSGEGQDEQVRIAVKLANR
jgi:DNA-binding MarR family transcriptional regulator